MAAEAARSILVNVTTAITRCYYSYAAALSRVQAGAFGLIVKGAPSVTTHGMSLRAQFPSSEGYGRFTLACVGYRDCSRQMHACLTA